MEKKIYSKVLDLLATNKIDTGVGHIACACDAAWFGLSKKHQNKTTFDDFCEACNDVWLDCDDETGLTRIADMVADYLKIKGELPYEYSDVLDLDEDEPDDEELKELYDQYVKEWKKEHKGPEYKGMEPACFDEWYENEYCEEDY